MFKFLAVSWPISHAKYEPQIAHLRYSRAKTFPSRDVKAMERLKEYVDRNQNSTRYFEPANIFCKAPDDLNQLTEMDINFEPVGRNCHQKIDQSNSTTLQAKDKKNR